MIIQLLNFAMAKKLTSTKILQKSGIKLTTRHIKLVKSHCINVLQGTVGGDAPKDLISVYHFGGARKKDCKKWTKYIAKIGHKWYPNESITEHFLSTVGKSFGMILANSRLIIAEDTIRYLSEHFHSDEQTLTHGANILSRHYNENDNNWIDELDRNNNLKGTVDVEDVRISIKAVFPEEYLEIFNSFLHMLLFDAVAGNNDRHYYNWGVITHIKNKHAPYFSPIYDTARGLLWNISDNNVISLYKQLSNADNNQLNKYVIKSVPKISVPGNNKCNHFELIEYLANKNYFN